MHSCQIKTISISAIQGFGKVKQGWIYSIPGILNSIRETGVHSHNQQQWRKKNSEMMYWKKNVNLRRQNKTNVTKNNNFTDKKTCRK